MVNLESMIGKRIITIILFTLSWNVKGLNGFTNHFTARKVLSQSKFSALLSQKNAVDAFDAVDDPFELIGREKLQPFFDFPIDSCKSQRK